MGRHHGELIHGETLRIPAEGRYFQLLAGPRRLDVEIEEPDGDKRRLWMQPGQVVAARRRIAAVTLRYPAQGYSGASERFSFWVGVDKPSAGTAPPWANAHDRHDFRTGAYTPTTAGLYSKLLLSNPASTNTPSPVLEVSRITAYTSGSAFLQLQSVSLSGSTNVPTGYTQVSAGPALSTDYYVAGGKISKGKIVTATTVAASWVGLFFTVIGFGDTSQNFDQILDPPLLVPPGQGLALVVNAATTAITGSFHWSESFPEWAQE